LGTYQVNFSTNLLSAQTHLQIPNCRLWNQPVADFVDLPLAIKLSGAPSRAFSRSANAFLDRECPPPDFDTGSFCRRIDRDFILQAAACPHRLLAAAGLPFSA
jgi:hypothetical protein